MVSCDKGSWVTTSCDAHLGGGKGGCQRTTATEAIHCVKTDWGVSRANEGRFEEVGGEMQVLDWPKREVVTHFVILALEGDLVQIGIRSWK